MRPGDSFGIATALLVTTSASPSSAPFDHSHFAPPLGWLAVREGTQQNSVHDAEDGGVRSDAEGDGEDGRGCEARTAAEGSGCVAKFLHD